MTRGPDETTLAVAQAMAEQIAIDFQWEAKRESYPMLQIKLFVYKEEIMAVVAMDLGRQEGSYQNRAKNP